MIKCVLDAFTGEEQCLLLNILDVSKGTAVHYSALEGYTSVLHYLLYRLTPQARYELLQKDINSGKTPLHFAALKYRIPPIKCILDSVTEEQRFYLMLNDSEKETFLKTPMLIATFTPDLATLKCLLDSVGPELQLQLVDHAMEFAIEHEKADATELLKTYKENALVLCEGSRHKSQSKKGGGSQKSNESPSKEQDGNPQLEGRPRKNQKTIYKAQDISSDGESIKGAQYQRKNVAILLGN